MAMFIKAGVLARDSAYFGASTTIPSKMFETQKMNGLQFGFLEPPTDSGVGASSNVLSVVEQTNNPNAKLGAWFYYRESSLNRDVRYFVSANSTGATGLGLSGALVSTNVNDVASVAVAAGSGYVLAS